MLPQLTVSCPPNKNKSTSSLISFSSKPLPCVSCNVNYHCKFCVWA